MTVAVVDAHPSGASVVYRTTHHAPARFQRAIASVEDLELLGRELHHRDAITQLWLTPRWQRAQAIAGLEHAWTPAHFAGNVPAAIVAPAFDRRLAAQLELVGGRELLATLELLHRGLGVAVEGTPGQTAEMLLRGVLGRRQAFTPLEASALPAVNEPTLAWTRELDTDERTRALVLAIDRRGAYLQSMLLCDVGVGNPIYVTDQWHRFATSESAAPGYYHARLKPWEVPYLPDPLRCSRGGDWHWLSAPALRLGVELEAVEDVDEAWVWPQRSRVLAPIAKRILATRRAFSEVAPELAPIADPLLKRAYTELVGRLRMEAHRGSPLYRPDWHAHIVADSRTRVWRAAGVTLAASGEAPAAVAVDCWYVLADRAELPPGFDPKFWRIEHVAPADKLRELFGGSSVAQLAGAVRREAIANVHAAAERSDQVYPEVRA